MRRATSLTDAPGANASATIARFCSSLHRRRRSGPDITSTRLIAPSLAPVQNTSLAPVPEQAGSIPRAQGGRYRTVTVEIQASLDFHGEELTSHDRRPNQPFSSPFASEP